MNEPVDINAVAGFPKGARARRARNEQIRTYAGGHREHILKIIECTWLVGFASPPGNRILLGDSAASAFLSAAKQVI